MKRNGRGRASSCSKGGVGAFQGDLQLGGAEGPHVGYLVGELKPGVALAVGQHRLKIGRRRGTALNGSPLEKATSSRRVNHEVFCRRSDDARVASRLYAAVSLILHQRFIDHALGKHLVGRIEMGIQRADVNRRAVVSWYGAA